jgi:protein SCO1/2
MGTANLEDPPAADPTPAQPPGTPRRPPRTLLLAVLAVAVIAAGVALLLSDGGGKSTPSTPSTSSASQTAFDGGLFTPSKVAPPLNLRNYSGGPRLNISNFHGRAVLVTFIYTHCPDVCPLMAANLGVALHLMSPQVAAKTQLLAISVDPRGDTRAAVGQFLKKHEVSGRMLYLTGTLHELARAWKAWGVGSERDAKNPEFIDHSAFVFGISGSGRLTTIYASNFKPAEVAHDAPLLAAQ